MKDIVILGPGCPNCERLAQNAEAAAKALGLEYQIYKMSDPRAISGFGVRMTPALMVGSEIKVSGRVPALDEIKALLLEGSAPKGTEPPDPAGSEMRMERP